MISTNRDTQTTASDKPAAALLEEALQQTVEQSRDHDLLEYRGGTVNQARGAKSESAKTTDLLSRIVDGDDEPAAPSQGQLAALRAVADQMADDVYAKLPVRQLGKPPAADDRTQRERLAEACRASDEFIRARFDSWQEWIPRIVSASVDYEENRSDVREADTVSQGYWSPPLRNDEEEARAKHLAVKRREAGEKFAAKVAKQLKLSGSAAVIRPWLNHERIERHTIEELYTGAPDGYRQRTRDAATAFLQCVLAARTNRVFGDIDVGRDSVEYSFGTHSVVDKLTSEYLYSQNVYDEDERYSEVVAQAEGTQTTSQVFHTHGLMDPEFFGFESTLGNPTLEIPPEYRTVLQEAPEEIRPHLTSVWGTQITEEAVSRDIESKEIREEQVLSRTRVLPCEPCVVLGGHAGAGVVLFGWGARLMKSTSRILREHRQVLDRERELLAEAHRAHGSYSTNLRWSAGLLALAVAELIFAIGQRSGGAVLVLLPILMFAALAAAITQHEMRIRWKDTLQKAENTIQDGFRSLCEKYTAFDPREPRVSPPEDARPKVSSTTG